MAALPDKVGYPALSELMASPGLSTFKRFAALNARNLLYMQAELLVLERELEEHVRRDEGTNPDPTDQNADPASRLYATSVEKLMESKDEGNGLQWDHILLIRSKLEAYNRALIQQANIAQIADARKYDHDLLCRWVNKPRAGTHIAADIGMLPFQPQALDDLLVLRPRPDLDAFTRGIAEHFWPWLSRKLLSRWKSEILGQPDPSLRHWDDKHFTAAVRVMSVLISTLFPSVAVLALYYIKVMSIRLGAVLLFSLLFSATLAAFTKARPVEIFAATAACASVQVVFVGSTSTLK